MLRMPLNSPPLPPGAIFCRIGCPFATACASPFTALSSFREPPRRLARDLSLSATSEVTNRLLPGRTNCR